jgi:arylsulfatase
VPALTGDGAVRREWLFFHHEGNRALRMGNWKLVSAREDQNVWELFDLGKDRCERVDLAAQHPDRVRRMEAKWNELETEFRRTARGPSSGPEE